jgi:hypothetical protein
LRERHTLAHRVRELHLSDFQSLHRNAGIEQEEIANLVASLVMVCPNLERLVGFYVPFSHAFDRLSHALSTRPNLVEKAWLLSEQDSDYNYEDDNEWGTHYLAERDPTERFLELNSRHTMLSTLVLHQLSQHRSASLSFRAIVGNFRQFSGLRHLAISGLSANSFTNLVLNALPSTLQSLRLENLPGIDDRGLQRFFTSQSAVSIETLTLINLDLTNLVTISTILSTHLAQLKQFTFAQQRAPGLQSQIPLPNFLAPSLQYLHWEIRSEANPLPTVFPSPTSDGFEGPAFPFTNQEPISCLATSLLAANMKDKAFPSLRRVRVPHDPQGVIQALCKPLATALIPSDTALFAAQPRVSISRKFTKSFNLDAPPSSRNSYRSFGSMRADSAMACPALSIGPTPFILTPARSRFAAQSRIRAARKKALITVRVHDSNGVLRMEKAIGGFIGTVGSKIRYDLKADRDRMFGGSVDNGEYEGSTWITSIQDLTGETAPKHCTLRSRSWGSCGHPVGGQVGRNVVHVKDLF